MTEPAPRPVGVAQLGSDAYLVSSTTTSQLVELTAGRVYCRYAGPRLTEADARAVLAAGPPTRPRYQATETDVADVGAGWTGSLSVEPLVRATAPDGAAVLQLRATGGEVVADGNGLVVTSEDPAGVRVRLTWTVRGSSAVIERSTSVTNTADGPMRLHRALSGISVLGLRPAYRRTYPQGRWGAESLVTRAPVTPGLVVQRTREGLRTFTAPWLMIDDTTANESAGDVWSVLLGWGGDGYLSTEQLTTGTVRVAAGVDLLAGGVELAPGQTYDTPPMYEQCSEDGFTGASQQWHDFVRAHVLPRTPDRPVLYNSWEATTFDVSESGQRELAARAARTGAELFVMDDGWFGARDDDHAGLGDWDVNPAKFPRGLGPLIDEVERLGMAFGIWVEPEMVNRDSDLYRSHPDWVLATGNRERSEFRHQLVLDFGRADVREWAIGWLDELLTDNRIAFVKWDCNRPLGEPASAEVPLAHVAGVQQVFAEVRRRHPDLQLEMCASGGARVSTDFLRFAEQAWTSDNTDAYERLVIQEGFSYVFPAVAMGAWVTDADRTHYRDESLGFRFVVAMQGVPAIGGDLLSWSDGEIDAAAGWVRLYTSRLRRTVQQGRAYRLESMTTPLSGLGRAGTVAYVEPDGGRAVVLSAGTGEWLDLSERAVRIPGLEPDAAYAVTLVVPDPGQDDRPIETDLPAVTGRSAATAGVRVPWRQHDPCLVLVLSRGDRTV